MMTDSMPLIFLQRAIADQILREFQDAFDELERASGQDKPEADARLNRAVRRLYDFVGYGKVPQDLQFEPFDTLRSARSGLVLG